MTATFQVGDLVITHTDTFASPVEEQIAGIPALVIATRRTGYPHWWQSLRLKMGEIEWWDAARHFEKVPE